MAEAGRAVPYRQQPDLPALTNLQPWHVYSFPTQIIQGLYCVCAFPSVLSKLPQLHFKLTTYCP